MRQTIIILNKNICRLMTKYCEKENIEKNCMFFRFNSDIVQPADTPESLGVKDGDVIFAEKF